MTAAKCADAQRGAAAAVVVDRPPLGNTGVKRTDTLGVSWLAGTIRGRQVGEVQELLGLHLGSVESLGYGFKWYEAAARVGVNGSALAWGPRGFEGRPVPPERTDEVSFQIVQSDLEQLGWDASVALVRALHEVGARFTRADCRYDDGERLVEPAVVLDTFRSGQVVSHVRTTELRDRNGAVTVYLGSRQSPAMLRVYGADARHGAGGVRWEYEAHGDRAQMLVEQVFLGRAPGRAFAEFLVHLVDFRDRRLGEAHGERSRRLDWWTAIVGTVARARLAVAVVVDSLQRRRDWVQRQVAPTLALLVAAEGGDLGWLEEQARQALRRVRESQWQLVPPELRPVWWVA